MTEERDVAYIDSLKNILLSSEETAKTASDNERALLALGEFARAWFKLFAITNLDASTDSAYSLLQYRLNKIRLGDEFDEQNVRDAIIGRGVFASADSSNNGGGVFSDGYSFLLANERKILDENLMLYLDDLAQKYDDFAEKGLLFLRVGTTSSFVREFLYDKINERLLISLDQGRCYEYDKVPGYAVLGMMQSESVGRFFNSEIKGGGYKFVELARSKFEEVKSRVVEDCYLRLNDGLEMGLNSILRRVDYDFKSCREKLRRIYGHAFDCALYALEAKLMYTKISVPVAKVLRWQSLEMRELNRIIDQLNQKVKASVGEPEIPRRNSVLTLTEDMRDFFALALATAKYDEEVARKLMAYDVTDYETTIEPYFKLYLAEVEKSSVPKDGSRETEKKNRRRIIRERAETIPDATV